MICIHCKNNCLKTNYHNKIVYECKCKERVVDLLHHCGMYVSAGTSKKYYYETYLIDDWLLVSTGNTVSIKTLYRDGNCFFKTRNSLHGINENYIDFFYTEKEIILNIKKSFCTLTIDQIQKWIYKTVRNQFML